MPYPIVNPLGSIHYTSKYQSPHCTDAEVMSSPVSPSLDDIYCSKPFKTASFFHICNLTRLLTFIFIQTFFHSFIDVFIKNVHSFETSIHTFNQRGAHIGPLAITWPCFSSKKEESIPRDKSRRRNERVRDWKSTTDEWIKSDIDRDNKKIRLEGLKEGNVLLQCALASHSTDQR